MPSTIDSVPLYCIELLFGATLTIFESKVNLTEMRFHTYIHDIHVADGT